ncbi:hypothetical protein HPP92_016528 [Vanilla planifolia]|uniref:Uncharacterized protein n=1 Tax=Vanilla planifolia TaxID=51239 RepID=A0A835US57_VANPL|nr:hypothetical protein HPP92_016528 [Vanilla planifolia]
MRKRWAPAALVAFLLLLSTLRPQSFSYENGAKFSKSKTGRNHQRKRSPWTDTKSIVSKGFKGCKSKRQCAVCVSLDEHRGGRNSSFLDDQEKRVVPTGPNPLHNR